MSLPSSPYHCLFFGENARMYERLYKIYVTAVETYSASRKYSTETQISPTHTIRTHSVAATL